MCVINAFSPLTCGFTCPASMASSDGVICSLILLMNLLFCSLFSLAMERLVFSFFIWRMFFIRMPMKKSNPPASATANTQRKMMVPFCVLILLSFSARMFCEAVYSSCKDLSSCAALTARMESCQFVYRLSRARVSEAFLLVLAWASMSWKHLSTPCSSCPFERRCTSSL